MLTFVQFELKDEQIYLRLIFILHFFLLKFASKDYLSNLMFIHPSFFPVKRTNINVIVDYTALQGKGAVSAYLTSKQILPLPLHGSADVTGTLRLHIFLTIISVVIFLLSLYIYTYYI